MYFDDRSLVLSPTDLTKHLACPHLTHLDQAAACGEIEGCAETDESLELIFRLGLEHERRYLDRLRDEGKTVVAIPDDDAVSLDERARLTVDAMARGAEVIYQATFVDADFRGHADFLLRADRSSRLGDWSYDVADTKLARRLKVAALLQMADYGRHLAVIQGCPPETLTVVTGDGLLRDFRYSDAAAYARRATASLRQALERQQPTRPEPVSHCKQCRWSPRCEEQWRREDHLSLVAFMRRDHREALEQAGITTVEMLAVADPDAMPADIGASSRVRLQKQAELQVRERRTGAPHYELLDPAEGLGLLRLPAPSEGDVYLDFEGDPYADGGDGREYLAGLWDRTGAYSSWWAHSQSEERRLIVDLIDELTRRLDADPNMHIYHYAPYERSALARLTQRHGVRESEFDRLLRGEVLVDLYGVVRQGLRISKGSYSIKKMEAFYWGGIRGSGDQPEDVADALASVVAYERWLIDRTDQSVLNAIRDYNRDDVRSTHDLHAWLEARRSELELRHGPLSRPALAAIASPRLTDAEQAEADLASRLLGAGHDLLAGLVGWHRRESRPQWWDHFRVDAMTDDELVRDAAALGELSEPVKLRVLPSPARSTIWRYTFPPQDTKISGEAWDADRHVRLGAIDSIDPVGGYLDLRLGSNRSAPMPRGLGPGQPFNTREQRASLERLAQAVLDGGSPLGQRLIERIVPADLRPLPSESPNETVVRVGRRLRGAVLAVQGPPGSGKTTVGAELIRALLDAGRKVGVTAQSHAVIGHLLTAVGRPALQKCDLEDHCGAPGVDHTGDNDDVVNALASGSHRLVGGSAWLWSRQQLADAVDVLIVDEAGQFSLANACAVAQAASGLVLLGDPQQLTQPSQTQHSYGADVSALDHMLDGAPTVTEDRGVFLDRSWRMHPSVCRVVSRLMYEGRLESAPGRELQLVAPSASFMLQNPHLPVGRLAGAGIRWVPVHHVGNASASTEEAHAVASIVDALVGGKWTDCDGLEHRLNIDDVLVVAPYNAHVARLRSALPAGVRIGTVDKFQGQEAPVAIYSMASSSVEDAPRGVSFLYDLHRLNVALSRARCLAIVVGSPSLLDAPVSSPDDLRRVNGLISVIAETG